MEILKKEKILFSIFLSLLFINLINASDSQLPNCYALDEELIMCGGFDDQLIFLAGPAPEEGTTTHVDTGPTYTTIASKGIEEKPYIKTILGVYYSPILLWLIIIVLFVGLIFFIYKRRNKRKRKLLLLTKDKDEKKDEK